MARFLFNKRPYKEQTRDDPNPTAQIAPVNILKQNRHNVRHSNSARLKTESTPPSYPFSASPSTTDGHSTFSIFLPKRRNALCICTALSLCVDACICVNVYASVCTYVCEYMCANVCKCSYLCVCVYMCVYTHAFARVYGRTYAPLCKHTFSM